MVRSLLFIIYLTALRVSISSKVCAVEVREGIYSQCSFTSVNKITSPGVGGGHGRPGGFGWLAFIRPHPQLMGGAWEPNANPQRRGRAAGEGGKSPGAAGGGLPKGSNK